MNKKLLGFVIMPTLARNSIQSNQIFIESFWRASLDRTLIRIQLELDQILIRLWSEVDKNFQVDDHLPSVSFANSHSAGDSPSETVRVGDNFWRLDRQNKGNLRAKKVQFFQPCSKSLWPPLLFEHYLVNFSEGSLTKEEICLLLYTRN